MRNKSKILLNQLEEKLKPFLATRNVVVPDRGWIHTIRTGLNMSMSQLGKKLGITRQGVKSIENSESEGTITLHSLKEAAKAMDMKLVYAVVPVEGTIDEMIDKKATNLARKIVLRTHQNMILEEQGIGESKIEEAIQEIAYELKREMKKSLWD